METGILIFLSRFQEYEEEEKDIKLKEWEKGQNPDWHQH